MRGRSSSSTKLSNGRTMEGMDKPPKPKQEPHLSGAYIRSLVKQLSSSRPKGSKNNTNPPDAIVADATESPAGESHHHHRHQSPPPPPPPQPPHQPKKQVRRRLHTSRPYQERLLNMAEARREIVTALKFHRAAMKQANQHQNQQQTPPPPPPPPPPQQNQLYLPNYPTNLSPNPGLSPFAYPSSLSWPYSPISSLPISDNLNFPLPNQPLGLNLNFQGFNNIMTPLYNNNNKASSPVQPLSPPSSSSSYSYSSPPPVSAAELAPPASNAGAPDPGAARLHPVMDDEEMAEIRSIGEQHDMEWNDTMNLMTTAWWSKFLKTMEVGSSGTGQGDGFQVFDESMDIPEWLSRGGSGGDASDLGHAMHFDDYCLQDASLPCLDIGEIEGLDGDWLS